MRLYLIRHGLAKSKEEDPERSLSRQGRLETEAMAKFVTGKLRELPQDIYHSGKARARETAEIFGEALGISSVVEVAENLAPEDDPAIWHREIRDRQDDMMLVGHLPFMSRLASLLLVGDSGTSVLQFANSAVACLEREGPHHWSLSWMMVPEMV